MRSTLGQETVFCQKPIGCELGNQSSTVLTRYTSLHLDTICQCLACINPSLCHYPKTTTTVNRATTILNFVVTDLPPLNLLGRNVVVQLGISVDHLLYPKYADQSANSVTPVYQCSESDASLRSACKQLCDESPDVFKNELGCLKDFKLDIKFRSDAVPIFCKPRPVPFALQEDLAHGYQKGIARGVWKPVQFNDYGTPVVPIKKSLLPGQSAPSLRVCWDYSVTINPQLETHRQPIPIP